MPDQEHVTVAGLTEPLQTAESIVLYPVKVAWLTEPLETAELIVLQGIRASVPCSDNRCAICHVPYGTPNEDGTIIEHALHFPCGHDVGNICCQDWPDEAWLRSGCLFCRKSVVPARFVLEQVKEIWAIAREMSLEDIYNERKIRGPLSRAIEPLRRYVEVGETASLRRYAGGDEIAPLKHLEKYCEAPRIEWLTKYHKNLAPRFERLLHATCGFLSAVQSYVEETECMNSQGMGIEAIDCKVYGVKLRYESFQMLVRDTAHLIHGQITFS